MRGIAFKIRAAASILNRARHVFYLKRTINKVGVDRQTAMRMAVSVRFLIFIARLSTIVSLEILV